MKVVIVGGGWSGCAAAVCARKGGAEVKLLERTDMILGTGLVGGIMRNNGRYTATEELIAMGGGEIFKIIDNNSRHKNINFPGHHHANLYDIGTTPGAIMSYLKEMNIDIVFKTRITKANLKDGSIDSIEDSEGNIYKGDVFIDTTGTAGPMNNCSKYGNGCAMCILRCPSFGGRVSLTGLVGIKEYIGKKPNGQIGAMSGSCKLYKESLSSAIVDELNTKGVAVVPIPEELIEDHLDIKACQQYALKEFKKNIILLDTGHAKLMTPFYDIEKLRRIPGFKNARYEDPYAGGKGNSMRFFAMAPRDNALKVEGINNLFCAGEKAGLLVGHTEAIVTGTLAGYNSIKFCKEEKLLEIPTELAIGEAIAYVREQMRTEEGLSKKYTFSGSVLFDRMKSLGLYSIDIEEINNKIERLGLKNIFSYSEEADKLKVKLKN
ncbi:FAD-dependent oxidoreductase [Clostridium tyrobutyricum]|uniref:FAD-dependent oxidoreductase n=1 Tax=Clostridium tyrobutyricum TaxID=1519 RepID=UPI001C38B522|nr:FAD-dependent oxidoreductase [Clostridium tyrobutyricum]MBV4415472.1 FAD-dependent oxidoreductase [Clostridium tyrobutyricum]MBV4421440.1 FAD-dependent oxidoreductase [Clostridium tyrobutyricum]